MKINNEVIIIAYDHYNKGNSVKDTIKFLEKYHAIKVHPEGLRKRFRKVGIPLRNNKEAVTLSKRKHIKIPEILDGYKLSKSIRGLSRKSGISRSTIKKILRENGVDIFSSAEAIQFINQKHPKVPFNGNGNEKAYIIGLVEGDLHARKRSNFILRLTSASTHSSFLELIKSVFNKYGPVYVYPVKYKEEYRWNITTEIDLASFSFLLNRKKEIYQASGEPFLYFIAGLIDSDGSIMVKKVRGNFQYFIRIFSQDKSLLDYINKKLNLMGFNSYVYLTAKKGKKNISKHSVIVYNRDYYYLELCRKKEVIELLSKLPVRHPEKIIRKKNIFYFEKKNMVLYKDIAGILEKTKMKFQAEVKKSVNEAKEKYNLRKKLKTTP